MPLVVHSSTHCVIARYHSCIGNNVAMVGVLANYTDPAAVGEDADRGKYKESSGLRLKPHLEIFPHQGDLVVVDVEGQALVKR